MRLVLPQPGVGRLLAVGPALVGTTVVVGALAWAHALTVSVAWDEPSPLMLASHLFSLTLLVGLVWLGGALGVNLLRRTGLGEVLDLENLLFSIGLGLGGLAYLVLALGFIGWLNPWALVMLLASLAVLLRSELLELARQAPRMGLAYMVERQRIQSEMPLMRFTLPVIDLVLVMTALRALAPPTGYDALLYHLTGSKEFLTLGRIVPLPEIQQANMPFTPQMLYLVGLAFGSDELGGLLHLTFATLLAVATFGLGRRLVGHHVGWLAATIFLSSTAFAVYAPLANIDFAWAYFDFLAVYAFLIWAQTSQRRWLILSGLAIGLSLGSKYFGVLTCAAISLAILLDKRAELRANPRAVRGLFTRVLLPAALVASPWYLKNWLWLGSPIWPFIASDVDLENMRYFSAEMRNLREVRDYLLLPLRLYQGDVEQAITHPPLLLALLPLYAFAPKSRLLNYLLIVAALYFAAWSQIRAVRYLFPMFPETSLVVGYILHASMRHPRWSAVTRHVVPALVGITVLIGAGANLMMFTFERPLGQLVGMESRLDYLRRVIPDIEAVRYVNDHREQVSRVIVVGDARMYYLEPPALALHNLDPSGLLGSGDPLADLAQLQREGVSHILVSQSQLDWLARHDSERRVDRWRAGFEALRSGYLVTEYAGSTASVYRVSHAVTGHGLQ